jgi:SecD/SecF fusion protein
MQNKGLIKFFAILFALVSIYQLMFTFAASKVEGEAKIVSKGDAKKEFMYLDSLGKKPVFLNYFTYNDIKEKQIHKGLDLEGGINVILEISVKDILKQLANNTKDSIFVKAIADATTNKVGNQDYIDSFFNEFDKAAAGKTTLSSPDIFSNRNLSDEINAKMTNSQVQKVIRRKVDESVLSAFEVLRKRIDKFGVTQPNIQRLGTSGRILVELPGAKDVDRIKRLLAGTAQLEFWETFKVQDMSKFLGDANETLKKTEKSVVTIPENTVVTDTTKTKTKDGKPDLNDLLVDKDKNKDAAKKGSDPLLDKFVAFGEGSILGYFNPTDTVVLNKYLKRDDIRILLPTDQRYAKFAWGKPEEIDVFEKQKVNPAKVKNSVKVFAVELYALKGNRDNRAPMSGGVITDAKDDFDPSGKPSVSMQMNAKGAKIWEELTGRAYATQGNIAIALDNIVYSAPGVTSGAISGGNSQISGNFTLLETADLSNVLRAGKLPASAEIVQSEVVGPSLGKEAIENGTLSSIVGLLLVSLWMMVYYGKSGLYANIALAVNLLFLFGVLASLGAVLTLPGIAGIVLTMGTAVDANIIIYERAKEELRSGKSLEDAIQTSFGWKGAMRSIIDANVTHVLTGLVLYVFGSGPIKGFATTLLIGIFTSLFTSIFITRMLLDWSVAKGNKLTFVTNFSKNWFTNFHFDFLGVKKWTYIFSSTVVVVSLISLFFGNGLNQGVDFVGGRTFQVRFEKSISAEAVKTDLVKAFGSVEAKTFGSDTQLKITTNYKVKETGIEVDKEINTILFDNLKKHFAAGLTYDKFVNSYEGKKIGVMQASKVGPSVADDIKTNAYWAVLGAMAIVFLYLMISFRKWQYSLGAIAAVAHDVIFVLGIYSLLWKIMPFGMEIDQHFIAAILTVIGYSMNDTVIVFDRVREYLGGKSKGTFTEIVNQSINTTMSRTINTSLTMILVLLIMFIFGGESIRGFIFAMLIGIVVGTYSSLFIATPVLVDTISASDKDLVEHQHND